MQYLLVNGRPRTVKAGVNVADAIALLTAKGRTVQKIRKPPTIAKMEQWMEEGVAKATDGCRVEPDGSCPHGHKSWLLVLGLV